MPELCHQRWQLLLKSRNFRIFPDFETLLEGFFRGGDRIVSIELRDHISADLFWTDRLTLIVVGAVTKPLRVHLANHSKNAFVLLRLPLRKQIKVGCFRPDKEHSASVLAGCDAGTTTDASSSVK